MADCKTCDRHLFEHSRIRATLMCLNPKCQAFAHEVTQAGDTYVDPVDEKLDALDTLFGGRAMPLL